MEQGAVARLMRTRTQQAQYDPAKLYAHPKRWGEQPTHPMNSGIHLEVERNRLRVLGLRKEKQAMLQPDKLEVSQCDSE